MEEDKAWRAMEAMNTEGLRRAAKAERLQEHQRTSDASRSQEPDLVGGPTRLPSANPATDPSIVRPPVLAEVSECFPGSPLDRFVCMQSEPHVIYEQCARGAKLGKDGQPAHDEELEKILANAPPVEEAYQEVQQKYALIITRYAREKWMAFTREELLDDHMNPFRFEWLICKTLFGGVPPQALSLTFLCAEEGLEATVFEAMNSPERLWEEIARPAINLTNDKVIDWTVIRNFSGKTTYLRDGRDIERSLAWDVGLDWRRAENQLTADAITVIHRLHDIVEELFPREFSMGSHFWLQVDRYKGEWLRLRPEWRLEADGTRAYAQDNEDGEKIRVEFMQRILWAIDDPVVNAYPAGWKPGLTYEQWEELLLRGRNTRAAVGRTPNIPSGTGDETSRDGGNLPPTTAESQDDHSHPPASTGQVLRSHPPSRANDSGGEPRLTNREEEPWLVLSEPCPLQYREVGQSELKILCGTDLNMLSQKERREHLDMHMELSSGKLCVYHEDCRARPYLMTPSERQRHYYMHGAPSATEKDAELRHFVYHDSKDRSPDAHCPLHPKCHARVNQMKRACRSHHFKMHQDNRCKWPRCHAHLAFLSPKEQDLHRKMHEILPKLTPDSGNVVVIQLPTTESVCSEPEPSKSQSGTQSHSDSKLAQALEKAGPLFTGPVTTSGQAPEEMEDDTGCPQRLASPGQIQDASQLSEAIERANQSGRRSSEGRAVEDVERELAVATKKDNPRSMRESEAEFHYRKALQLAIERSMEETASAGERQERLSQPEQRRQADLERPAGSTRRPDSKIRPQLIELIDVTHGDLTRIRQDEDRWSAPKMELLRQLGQPVGTAGGEYGTHKYPPFQIASSGPPIRKDIPQEALQSQEYVRSPPVQHGPEARRKSSGTKSSKSSSKSLTLSELDDKFKVEKNPKRKEQYSRRYDEKSLQKAIEMSREQTEQEHRDDVETQLKDQHEGEPRLTARDSLGDPMTATKKATDTFARAEGSSSERYGPSAQSPSHPQAVEDTPKESSLGSDEDMQIAFESGLIQLTDTKLSELSRDLTIGKAQKAANWVLRQRRAERQVEQAHEREAQREVGPGSPTGSAHSQSMEWMEMGDVALHEALQCECDNAKKAAMNREAQRRIELAATDAAIRPNLEPTGLENQEATSRSGARGGSGEVGTAGEGRSALDPSLGKGETRSDHGVGPSQKLKLVSDPEDDGQRRQKPEPKGPTPGHEIIVLSSDGSSSSLSDDDDLGA